MSRHRKSPGEKPTKLKWALYLRGSYIEPEQRFATKREATIEQVKALKKGIQAVVMKL